MKHIIRNLSLMACIFISHNIYGQTQLEMNQEAGNNYIKAEQELNRVYNKILEEYQSDSTFIHHFKNTQRIWILLRDAEMKSKYPERERGYYGSAQPMCWNLYLTALTEERTKKLKIWLEGTEEGDVCAGSVKKK